MHARLIVIVPLATPPPKITNTLDRFSVCRLTQDLTILGFDWRNNGGVEAHGEQTAQKICDV